MIEINEVLYRWSQGMKKRAIARALNISKTTVRGIINQAIELGLVVGDPLEKVNDMVALLQRNNRCERPSRVQEQIKVFHEQIKIWLNDPHITVTQMVRLFAEQNVIFKETSLRDYIKRNFETKRESVERAVI